MIDNIDILTANTSQVGQSASLCVLTQMELRVQHRTIGGKLVVYGSVGDKAFYVQAETPEELQEKLSRKIQELNRA